MPGVFEVSRELPLGVVAVANITEAIEGWLEVMESKSPLDPSRMVEVVV